jgi:hypothetical protein
MISDAIRKRPKRVATTLGNIGQLSYAVVPGAQDLVVNRAYKLFPEGESGAGTDRKATELPSPEEPDQDSAERRAFVRATRGVHW